MRHMRYWLSSKRLLIAQCEKAQRQLQEVWDRCDTLITERALMAQDVDCLRIQLNRVSRERFDERELRLAAEDALLAHYLDRREDAEIEQAAEELRDTYLEQLENEEE